MMYSKQHESPGLMSLLNNPDDYLVKGGARYLKNHRDSIVSVVDVDHQRFVVKRYNNRGIWYSLKRAVRKTRALRSWTNAQSLLAHGIPTAPPVAVIENRIGPVRLISFFVSEHIEGELCSTYFASPNISVASKERVAAKIVKIFQKLASAKMSHGDMKATNIVIHNESPVLMDIDVVRVHRLRWRHKLGFRRDVRRFLRNWEDQPAVMEMFRTKLESIVL